MQTLTFTALALAIVFGAVVTIARQPGDTRAKRLMVFSACIIFPLAVWGGVAAAVILAF